MVAKLLRLSIDAFDILIWTIFVTGSGILGLMEVLVEIWVFTFFESLICLKYTGKILDSLSQNS